METVTRAFKEFFRQLSYRRCEACQSVYPKVLMFRRNGGWACRSCVDPKYKAFIDSVGV